MALWPAFYDNTDRSYSTDYGAPISDLNYAYESGEPKLIEYDKSYAYYSDDSLANSSELNYSVYSYSEPKILQYDPSDQYHSYNYYQSYVNPSETYYIQPKFLQYDPSPTDSETKFTISYSTIEFNEPEFEEYDPTPYGGGYDPVTTYGKPLPPSEATCYPPTLPKSDDTSPENFSFSSIPSPYGKDDDAPTAKPPNADKVTDDGKDDHAPTTKPPNADKVTDDGKDDDLPTKPPIMIPTDDSPRPYENEFETESEKPVLPQFSYGSGLEAIDLCESLFGYWPCLAKQSRDKCRACEQEIEPDPWDQRAVDYLFGSPIVYDYQNYQHW